MYKLCVIFVSVQEKIKSCVVSLLLAQNTHKLCMEYTKLEDFVYKDIPY